MISDLNGKIFWTSGNDKGTEGTFVWDWEGTNLELIYKDWGGSEPNNGGGAGQDCLSLHPAYNHKWDDDQCTDAHASICELRSCT